MIKGRLHWRMHIFVASANIVDTLCDNFYLQRKRLKVKLDTHIRSNKRDRIYLCPVLLGGYLCCNWSTIKKRTNFRVWSFHKSSGKHHDMVNKISTVIINWKLRMSHMHNCLFLLHETWTEPTKVVYLLYFSFCFILIES